MTYDPTRDLTKLKGKEYLEVKYRLLWLRDRDPDARITTELVTPPTADELVVRAEVTLTTGGCATAYGACGRSEFGDALEKAETKAIGRALGALGFGTQFAGTELDYGADDGRVVDAPMAPRTAPAIQTATDRQVRAIIAVGRAAGWPDDEIKTRMVERYGVESRSALTTSQASDFITHLETEPAPARG
ncbi:MAG TPA: hypothetical protein PL172_14290 [Thermomicrobiales bacterium]|nr:hypothetical protein [Thermomicrobiales bacterium]